MWVGASWCRKDRLILTFSIHTHPFFFLDLMEHSDKLVSIDYEMTQTKFFFYFSPLVCIRLEKRKDI